MQRRLARFGLTLLLCVSSVATAAAQTTADRVIVAVGPAPRGVAIDTTRNLALVGNFGEGAVALVDLATGRVLTRIENVSNPAGIDINTRTGIAVVANTNNNTVTLIDIGTRRVVRTIDVESAPTGVAINATTNIAVIGNGSSNSVSLVDLTLQRQVGVITGIPGPNGLQGVAVDAELNVAVVASSATNSVFIIDLATRRIRRQIGVEQTPIGVAIDPVGKIAVVANLNSNSVSLVDVRTETIRAVVTGIPLPQAVAINANTRSALVSTGANGTVEIVSLTANGIEGRIIDLPGATGIAVNGRTGEAAVTLPQTNSLAVLRRLPLFTMVSAATYGAEGLAANSIASGFGVGLSTRTESATRVPLPATLGDLTLRMGSTSAPLFFVSPTQVNFQVPRLQPAVYPVEVVFAGRTVATGLLNVVQAAPGFFTDNQQGTGAAAALNEDNTRNSLENRAPRGTIVQLFGTGAGSTRPEIAAGNAATGPAPTVLTATATVGGIPAEVQYSGAAPGLVGVWQLNVRIPANVTPGNEVPVAVTLGTRVARTVTISVQ